MATLREVSSVKKKAVAIAAWLVVVVVLALATLREVDAAKPALLPCKPKFGLTKSACALLARRCGTEGIGLKWVAKKCKRSKENGCQCNQFCGYKCQGNCRGDPQCIWQGGRCLNKVTLQPESQLASNCLGPSQAPVTAKPTMSPITTSPSQTPSKAPTTSKPSLAPSVSPHSSQPTSSPTTKSPSESPSRIPSVRPTSSPSRTPSTSRPSRTPSKTPTTARPSAMPSRIPTTSKPSRTPSKTPSIAGPSAMPSKTPTTSRPSHGPSRVPSVSTPSRSPSRTPTMSKPSSVPSRAPWTASPSRSPSRNPSTSKPSPGPSRGPSTSTPSRSPSRVPTTTQPSNNPTTSKPSPGPSKGPSTSTPSRSPSRTPSMSKPSAMPSRVPSKTPTTTSPSRTPSRVPTTSRPSMSPSRIPTTSRPSKSPSKTPSTSVPSRSPSARPVTSKPSRSPSRAPSTSVPSRRPSARPVTSKPSRSPSRAPSTSVPSRRPSMRPSTSVPSGIPTTSVPSFAPTRAVLEIFVPAEFGTSASFGVDMALSGDGNWLLVGASFAYSTRDGAAVVYQRSGRNWNQQRIFTEDNGGGSGYFKYGEAVDIDDDGTRVAVSAIFAPSITVFNRIGSTWSKMDRLVPSGYAGSISISGDGNTLMFSTSAGADCWQLVSGTWTPRTIVTPAGGFLGNGYYVASSVSFDGSRLLMRLNETMTFIYKQNASFVYAQEAILSNSSMMSGPSGYGGIYASKLTGRMNGDATLAVVCENQTVSYVFERQPASTTWTQSRRFDDGLTVALSRDGTKQAFAYTYYQDWILTKFISGYDPTRLWKAAISNDGTIRAFAYFNTVPYELARIIVDMD